MEMWKQAYKDAEGGGENRVKKPNISDIALVISISTLLFQLFCHFILPRYS